MERLLFIVICLFLVGCAREAEIPSAPEGTPAEPIIAQPVPALVEEPVVQKPLLSELRCVNDQVSGVVYNNEDSELRLAKDIKVFINGLVVVDPVCDNLTIAPHSSVFCQDLSGHFNVRRGKTNTIKLNLKSDSIQEVVECE